MNRKVLINATSITKDTGIYSYLNGLLNALNKRRHSYDCTLRIRWSRQNMFGRDRKYFLKTRLFDRKKLPQLDVDIWYFPFQNFEWWYFEKVKMKNMILTVHDINFYYECSPQSHRFQKNKDDILKKIEKAKKIIAISEFTKSDLINKLGIEEEKIQVIHNGYSLAEYPAFNRPKYKPHKDFIFSLGSRRNKNIHLLPALLKGNNDELLLGRLRPYSKYGREVMATAKRLGVSDRVKILGHLSEEEKYWYYKHCKAFAFPSSAEGFGLPVLEAMHFGKPVFLSIRTSLPEIGGKEAYYFEDLEAEAMNAVYVEGMKDYMSDPDKKNRTKMWAQQFSWDKTAESLIRLFDEILETER